MVLKSKVYVDERGIEIKEENAATMDLPANPRRRVESLSLNRTQV